MRDGYNSLRKSKDKVIGNRGKNFFYCVESKGWFFLNEAMEGGWGGEFTFTGYKGNTVIDYACLCWSAFFNLLIYNNKRLKL